MYQPIINCIDILNKSNNLTITSSDNKIFLNYEIINVVFKYFQTSENTIQIEPESFPLAHHILRITEIKLNINNTFKIDYLFDVLNCFTDIITTGPYRYCTVCGHEILSSNAIGFCTKNNSNNSSENCFDNFCYYPTDNCII